MKKIKVFSALLLTNILLLTAIVSVNATTYYYSSGYELYSDESGNGWIINSYAQNASEIIIPDVLIEKSVTTIGGRSFEKRTELSKVVMPDTITTIGSYAFDDCSYLSNVSFSKNLQYIYAGAFRRCSSLGELDLSETRLSLIGSAAFYSCNELQEVILPDTLETISGNAFANCSNLNKIVIGRNVTSIVASAFNNSPNTVIHCYYDSVAYQYAVEKGISYVLLDEIKLGDTDGDGYVNINDVTHIQRHLAELENLEGIYLHVADANQDGTLDISDATTLQMYLAEYDIPYPIDEIMTQ